MAEAPEWVGAASRKNAPAPAWVGASKASANTVEPFEKEAQETLASTPAERIAANPIVRVLTSAAEPVLGAAALLEKPFGGTAGSERLKQLHGMQERGGRALGFSPASGVVADIAGGTFSAPSVAALKSPTAASALGRIAQNAGWGTVSGVTSNPDKPLTEGAKGALFGGGISALPELVGKIAGKVLGKPLTLPERETGEGAEAAVNELQRQRGVLESGKVGPTTGTPSAVETALAREKGATGEFKDVLQNIHGNFDVDPALKQIEQHLGGKALDESERSALNRVKKAIATAVENSNGKTQTIMTAGGPMMVVGNKLVPAKSASGLPIDYLDAVRQVIKKEITGKDQSGKPLSKDAQRMLMDVRDALIAKTPDEYRNAIAGMSETKAALDTFTAGGTAMKEVTGEPATFNLLNRKDKQTMLENAFKSKAPGRALSELVRDTAHDPKAAQGVRSAYTDWLTIPDVATGLPPRKQLLKKWEDTLEAVKSSKLMSDEHIAAMDTVMNDVREADQAGVAKKAWSSTAGFFLGLQVGHPIVAAHLARDLVGGGTKAEAVEDALERAMMNIMSIPDAAKVLAAPPTEANINKVMQYIQPFLNQAAISDTKTRARQTPPSQKIANPFGVTGVAK